MIKKIIFIVVFSFINPLLVFAHQNEFIDAGNFHSLALKNNKTVWAWGANDKGQLGLGNASSDDVKIPTESNMVSATDIACGFQHSVALKTDGSVWTYGSNIYKQLGRTVSDHDGVPGQATMTNVPSDAQIIDIAAGHYHTLVLDGKNNGTVWGWGYNDYKQISPSNFTADIAAYQAKTDATTALTGVKAIDAGFLHSIALVTENSNDNDNDYVYIWGQIWDEDGNTIYSSDYAVKVVKDSGGDLTSTEIKAIAAGANHDLALINGEVWAWGSNSNGQLGDGTNTDYANAIKVFPKTNELWIVAIAAGGTHSLALRNDGVILAWGDDVNGQLGNGSTTQDVKTPTPINNTWPGTVIAAGLDHSMALSHNVLYLWGYNNHGQIGDNSTINRIDPVKLENNYFGFICDINGDGKYDLADIIDGLRICVGQTPSGTPNPVADIDGDDKIGLPEVLGRMENEIENR